MTVCVLAGVVTVSVRGGAVTVWVAGGAVTVWVTVTVTVVRAASAVAVSVGVVDDDSPVVPADPVVVGVDVVPPVVTLAAACLTLETAF